MSEHDFTVHAKTRTEEGKGASRRLRRTNLVPAIVYGGNSEPVSITVKLNEIVKHLEFEAFYAHVLQIEIDGKAEEAILRDVQRHPSKRTPMHLDFMRVVKGQAMTKRVPLHFINEESSKGVKQDGGVPNRILNDVTVSCIPSLLPEYIEVDLIDLGVGENIHLTDIKLPAGVTLPELETNDVHDLVIFTMEAKKGADTEETDEATEAEPEAVEDDSAE